MKARRDSLEVKARADFILQEFLAARRKGDDAEARRRWDELVGESFDLVVSLVRAESHGRLSRVEQDDAVQVALIKLSNNMIDTFSGRSMGEWVNATKQLVKFACMDVQRREQRHSEHQAPLHATGDAGEENDQYERGALRASADQEALEHDAEAEAELYAEGAKFLDWAAPRLSPKRRQVLELDRAGVSCEEIEKQLGVSRDVVYASRSRGLKDLQKLREEYSG